MDPIMAIKSHLTVTIRYNTIQYNTIQQQYKDYSGKLLLWSFATAGSTFHSVVIVLCNIDLCIEN